MLTIKKNFEFKRVLSKGKYFNSNNLAIYFFPNRLNLLRFGFAVGKKAGKAVERNRIKRIIKDVFVFPLNCTKISLSCRRTNDYGKKEKRKRKTLEGIQKFY